MPLSSLMDEQFSRSLCILLIESRLLRLPLRTFFGCKNPFGWYYKVPTLKPCSVVLLPSISNQRVTSQGVYLAKPTSHGTCVQIRVSGSLSWDVVATGRRRDQHCIRYMYMHTQACNQPCTWWSVRLRLDCLGAEAWLVDGEMLTAFFGGLPAMVR